MRPFNTWRSFYFLEVFKTTANGQYDIEAKRVCNVGDATELYDAINLFVLKHYLNNLTIKLHGSTLEYCESRILPLENQLRAEIASLREEVKSMKNGEPKRKVAKPTPSPPVRKNIFNSLLERIDEKVQAETTIKTPPTPEEMYRIEKKK